MFTIEHIKAAHSKVKSGADFPNYIQDIIKLGVTSYETFVSDGHTEYFGENNFHVSSDKKYESLSIAKNSSPGQFISGLKEHQQGKTDYLTFCDLCASTGVYKWIVDMDKMTCSYYDQSGQELLVEQIPQPK